LALLLAFLGVHAVYVGSFLELKFHLDTSYRRVLFQLVPAALVWFGALLQGALDERTPVAANPPPLPTS